MNATLKSLVNVLKSMYQLNPGVVTIAAVVTLYAIYITAHAIDKGLIYTSLVVFLFLILSVCLYIKEKSSLQSMFSFSLGLFTAFTVPWNTATFTIFCISFIVLVTFIFLVSAIRMAADVEEKITIASSFYIANFDDSKKTLSHVQAETAKYQHGLLDSASRLDAIVNLAYRKVPSEDMVVVINTLNLFYTVTKIAPDQLLEMLYTLYVYGLEDQGAFIADAQIAFRHMIEGSATPLEYVAMIPQFLYPFKGSKINLDIYCDSVGYCIKNGLSGKEALQYITSKSINS